MVLVGIGYTNFSSNSSISDYLLTNTISVSSTNNIGDVQLVSSSATLVENEEKALPENVVRETKEEAIVSNENDIKAQNNNYFSELKMQRNDMYSKSLETYQIIVDNSSISSEQKSIAIQEIQKINNEKNAINIAEELIKLKGFDDVVIYSTNGKISVIVRVATLSNTQVAQIQNIISKELGVEISNITISNK